MGKYTREASETAEQWKDSIQRGLSDFTDRENPFLDNIENITTRHKLVNVTDGMMEKSPDKAPAKIFTWDVWTASEQIAKGVAYRATQRGMSSVFRRNQAEVVSVEEKDSGGVLKKRRIKVKIDERVTTDFGWTDSVKDGSKRWADAFRSGVE